MKILVLNGPNLNLLGLRETEIYGDVSMDEYLGYLREHFSGHEILYVQSNHEGDLIDTLHQHGFTVEGIVINPGAYTHTSIAIRDAIASISTPVVEVHISDIYSREEFRHYSYIKDVCVHQIIGQGLEGYKQGIQLLLERNSA
ncbi:MAG: 3-dehydroquinate dehydratase [Saprospiraceae bacterium]|nr:3-dehydroquinate dehydratase [Saprospiraceae bacterium]